jgi:hypothetical protein
MAVKSFITFAPGPIRDTISREVPTSVTCRHENCIVTFDKRHLKDSDAVLLSFFDLKVYLSLGPTLAWILVPSSLNLCVVFTNLTYNTYKY